MAEVEVWRGGVASWECDQMGHLNVGFYVANEAMAPQMVWQGISESDLPKIWIPKATDLRRIEAAVVGIVDRVDINDTTSDEMREAARRLVHENGRS